MSELRRCDLCGLEAHPGDVVTRPVAWIDQVVAEGVKPWDTVDRCRDFQACRSRVEAKGERWPVRDVVTQATVEPPPPVEEEIPL